MSNYWKSHSTVQMIIYHITNGKLKYVTLVKMNGNHTFVVPKKWHEVKLQDFQYKINNNILVTIPSWQKLIKIDSGVCSYRKEQSEKYTICFCHVQRSKLLERIKRMAQHQCQH